MGSTHIGPMKCVRDGMTDDCVEMRYESDYLGEKTYSNAESERRSRRKWQSESTC
jgi:hypothetical protein